MAETVPTSLDEFGKAYMTVRELADYMGVDRKVIYSDIKSGALRVWRRGVVGRIRIHVADAKRYTGEDRG